MLFIIDPKQGCDKHFGCYETGLGMSLLVRFVLGSPKLDLASGIGSPVDMRYASRQAPMLYFILLNNAFIFCSTKTQHSTHFHYVRIPVWYEQKWGRVYFALGASPEGMAMKTHDSFE